MITIGIDPHKSSLTAVAVEVTGKSVATMRIAITVTTVRQLQEWAACGAVAFCEVRAGMIVHAT